MSVGVESDVRGSVLGVPAFVTLGGVALISGWSVASLFASIADRALYW